MEYSSLATGTGERIGLALARSPRNWSAAALNEYQQNRWALKWVHYIKKLARQDCPRVCKTRFRH